MLWLLFSLICAFFFAVFHIVSKKVVKDIKSEYLAISLILLDAIIALPIVIILWPKFDFNLHSMLGILVVGLIMCITRFLYMRSVQLGDISKTVPLLSLTPLVTVPIALFLVREMPSDFGFVGILIIVVGAYILNIKKFSETKILMPFKAIFRSKASFYMLIVAILYGIGSSFDKFTINHSGVLFRLFLWSYFALVFQAIFLVLKDRQNFLPEIKKIYATKFKGLLLLVLLEFLVFSTQVVALSMTLTAYVIAVKRISAIFAVVFAYFIFKEKKNFLTNLAGTALLVVGVLLLAM